MTKKNLNLLNSRIDAYREASSLCRDGYRVIFIVDINESLVFKMRHMRNRSVITIFAYDDCMCLYRNGKYSKSTSYTKPLADIGKGFVIKDLEKTLIFW